MGAAVLAGPARAEAVAALANMTISVLGGSSERRAQDNEQSPGTRGLPSFGVVGERAGQDGCGVWPMSLTHRNPASGARSACVGPAGVSQRGGPAVDLIHEFPVHLPGGVEVVRELTGVGLELADLPA
jgi:hypothetical protein